MGLVGGGQALYENAPPADRAAYKAARSALPPTGEGDLAGEEIDRFLSEVKSERAG